MRIERGLIRSLNTPPHQHLRDCVTLLNFGSVRLAETLGAIVVIIVKESSSVAAVKQRMLLNLLLLKETIELDELVRSCANQTRPAHQKRLQLLSAVACLVALSGSESSSDLVA
jgi:hypothetical protein